MLESTIRRRAKTRGLKLEKARTRNPENPAFGTYRIVDPIKNQVVFLGSADTFGASLEQCAEYINPEAVDRDQPFDSQQHEAMLKLVEERFGHLEKLSTRQNSNDLRYHGTK